MKLISTSNVPHGSTSQSYASSDSMNNGIESVENNAR